LPELADSSSPKRNSIARNGFLRLRNQLFGRENMGKGILLWLLGIPIPIIILLLIFWH
jgi:hypothetical protein